MPFIRKALMPVLAVLLVLAAPTQAGAQKLPAGMSRLS